jgi:gamma-glutamyltranspeptidase/glutathione hydrolase
MVSAGHSAASLAAMRILDAGGNATDAGVAGGLCINVVQPDLTSIGGVAPICLFDAASEKVLTISGLGTWPMETDVSFFAESGRISAGVNRSVVPGAMYAWLTALELYGTMTVEQVLTPAIELARDGFPMHQLMVDTLSEPRDLANMRSWPSTAEIYLDENGDPYQVGEIFVQADLGRTLQRLVDAAAGATTREDGVRAARDLFYRGEIAEQMVEFSRSQGGWLSKSDLANFSVEIEEALHVEYRGYDIYACGVWSQGPVVLQALNILEGFDFGDIARGGADHYHLVLEALKCAFADRDRYYADPRFVQVPVDGLLSKAYAAERRASIDLASATPGMPNPGRAWEYSADAEKEPTRWRHPDASAGRIEPDTSYIAVVDSQGNAFSATPSDGLTGTPVVPGLGFIMSGRGLQSWLDPDHPSSIQPGKRPRLTPSPGMVIRKGEFVMPYGTPGTDVQPQAMTQFVLNVVDYGLSVQAAVEEPRVVTYSFPGTGDPHAYSPGLVKAEARIDDAVTEELRARGHRVERWPAWTGIAGSMGAVCASADGVLRGAADPRRLAYAVGR